MLCLTRREGERIVIDGNVLVEIIKICQHSGKVMVGVTAPADVVVDREEVAERRKATQDTGRYQTAWGEVRND